MNDATTTASSTRPEPDIIQLQDLLARCCAPERPGFSRRLRGIRKRLESGQPAGRGLQALTRDLNRSVRARQLRADSLPVPDFRQALPVNDRRGEIAEAIGRHQVVVLCGETGSGKSTQLPQICLALGRGVDGMIAHTQPRRLAARSLAARIADELGTELGAGVGYKIRFTDQVSEQTHVKLLTDGMLLAEIQGDRDLTRYDTIIIDEAHERSLNIDFLLGYFKQLLPRRPDLKLIITSATIDPQLFARHFDDAPVIQVSGRTFPVEVRYRPLVSEDEDQRDLDLVTGVLHAVDELAGEGSGDVLVFLSGEREIRDTAEALRKHHPPHTEILPLYARLSAAEQQRVFAPHRGRRVVLATNVAETSVTVPGIRYVVDTGLARISRYSYRTKVQRLPVEAVSRASADQRAGRCGRVAPGICIRLFSEEDYNGREEFTPPEIVRTNLASVILQMETLRLGAVDAFPFVEPPDRRSINDGYKLLHELAAVDDQRRLTPLGQRLGRLPVEPSVGRMLLAAEDEGALDEVLVIASALSIPDPRDRPADVRQAADQAHARWKDERSDFMAYLRLWQDWQQARGDLSSSKQRAWAREHFLSWVRLREWGEVHRQLKTLANELGLRRNGPGAAGPPPAPGAPAGRHEADHNAVHRALLTGMLSNVAVKAEEEGYTGARNLKLTIFPGSALARRKPRWIMAAELVETSRVFARTVAEIQPAEIERYAAHLVNRQWAEPHWDPKRGQVRAFETVTLYGLVLSARRLVNYGAIAPAEARVVFLREGLAQDRVASRGGFLGHNRELMASIRELEEKSRRRDVLVDEDVLFAFYDARIPAEVVDLHSFESWRKRTDKTQPRLLFMGRDDLMQHDAGQVTANRFPDHLTIGRLRLPLAYRFEPGHSDDGVSVRVPLAALNQLQPEPLEWLVPGVLEDKVVAMIRGLPKSIRRNFVPVPDYAREALNALPHRDGSLLEGLRRELRRMSGVDVPPEQWDSVKLDDHFRMNIQVTDGKGGNVAAGRDLRRLQADLSGEASRAFTPAPSESAWEREGLGSWDFGELPETLDFTQDGIRIQGYPALLDRGADVALKILDSPEQARTATRAGVRRLLMRALPEQVKYLRQSLVKTPGMALAYRGLGSTEQLAQDLVLAVFDRVFLKDDVPHDATAFRRCLEQGRAGLVEEGERFAGRMNRVLGHYQVVRKALKQPRGLDGMESMRDLGEHLDALVFPGFMQTLPAQLLDHLPRYLEGLAYRLEKLPADPRRDVERTRQLRPWWEAYQTRAERQQREGIDDPALLQFRQMLEEYRISLYAQPLGTVLPVSDKRLKEQWKHVR